MEAVIFWIWIVNPLEKVLQDTLPKEGGQETLYLECATNEYEAGQFAIRSNVELEDVSIEVTDLVNEENNSKISSENLQWNFVGFIPIEKNSPQTPEEELVCKAPCSISDPILEKKNLSLEANQTQPVWLTIYVPTGTQPGVYRGEAKVLTSAVEKAIPLELTVYPFELPEERHLYVTNWFSTGNIVKSHNVESYSEEFWNILEKYAQNMYQHRQNVAITPWRLIKFYREENGEFSFDYSNFDRYVETFIKAGVDDRIELSHVAHFGEGGWGSKEIVLSEVNPVDQETGEKVALPDNQGLEILLRNLQEHLQKKGWLKRTVIHVADEPSFHNLESWKEAAKFVHSAAPEIEIIDAIEGTGFGDLLDVWVPKLNHLRNWFDSYKQAQKSGAELWFYTCCHPYGAHYPNRFLDYPLSETRILHWMNYMFDLEGYLHWGLNHWRSEPFGVPSDRLPPGDTHIIYPGDNKPLNSIRWEMLREGLEDFEYLWLLESKVKQVKQKLGPAAESIPSDFRSKEICGKLVKSFTEYANEPDSFYSAKRLIASEIIEIDKSPLILLATEPSTNIELITGPIVIKVYGVVENGTKVSINESEVEVNSDGSFVSGLSLSRSNNTVKVEAEKNGKKKTLIRRFEVK